jgi:hypothetical protein
LWQKTLLGYTQKVLPWNLGNLNQATMSDTQLPQFFWDDEVTPSNRSGPDWIWHGLLARRTTTLLTGHGKLTGKTTLLSILLSRRARGGQVSKRTFLSNVSPLRLRDGALHGPPKRNLKGDPAFFKLSCREASALTRRGRPRPDASVLPETAGSSCERPQADADRER